MKYIILDTETTNDIDCPLVYDFGFAVIDETGKVYASYSYVNADIFCDDELMKTAFFAEYGTTGEGANPKARVKWSHQLKNDKDYTVEKILGGNDGWDPRQVK